MFRFAHKKKLLTNDPIKDVESIPNQVPDATYRTIDEAAKLLKKESLSEDQRDNILSHRILTLHDIVLLKRHWLTDEAVSRLGLNERQRKGVEVCRACGQLTNAAYQAATGATRPTAKRDLVELVRLGLFIPAGAGRSAHYLLAPQRLINGSNGSPEGSGGNGS